MNLAEISANIHHNIHFNHAFALNSANTFNIIQQKFISVEQLTTTALYVMAIKQLEKFPINDPL